MSAKIGERVGCILSSDGKTVSMLGFGLYDCNDVPYGAVGPLADQLIAAERRNPKIVLDNGKVVWGCECWWGSEAEIRKAVAGKTVTEVDIDEIRSAYVPPRRWFEPED